MSAGQDIPRRLYTVPEVADMLGLAKSAVWLRVHDGRLASVKIGRARRITAEEIDRFIADSATEADQ